MLIEFFSQPGSGKSTITNALIRSKPGGLNISRPVRSTTQLSKGRMLAKIINPFSIIQWSPIIPLLFEILWIKDYPLSRKQRMIASTLLNYLELREYATMELKPSEHILYDQGVFNFLLGLLHLQDNFESEHLQRILNYYLPFMENFIVLVGSLDVETNAVRLRNRRKENSIIDSLEGDELINTLYRLDTIYTLILKTIEDNGIKTIKIDMSSNVEDNTNQIFQELAKYGGSSTSNLVGHGQAAATSL